MPESPFLAPNYPAPEANARKKATELVLADQGGRDGARNPARGAGEAGRSRGARDARRRRAASHAAGSTSEKVVQNTNVPLIVMRYPRRCLPS